jgi:proline iminopeptidase
MNALYPLSESRVARWIDVGDGHEIYVEEAGNPQGIPIVFLHGGPGSGCKPSHRQFFDPARYRSFLIDQRGAGRSRPYGETSANTTAHLVRDFERVRELAGIERWVLFGGSWGAALALAYAETFPARVAGMILRGSFLARPRDLEWFVGGGAARLLPRAWAEFEAAVAPLPPAVENLHAAVFGVDGALAARVAQAWSRWSGEVVTYALDAAGSEAPAPIEEALAKTRIELHYALNRYFLAPDQLLGEAGRLPQVPVHIVHGQRDITCPAEAAWELHRAIPWSTLEILRTSGHLSSESALGAALVRAADALIHRL